MRLVIDLQGAQGVSRLRGIGRLSRELALAVTRECGDHEVLLALNGAFPDAVDDLSATFSGVVGRDAVRVWYPAGRASGSASEANLRLMASEHIRAEFLRSLAPDLVHVSSLFEGLEDDVITSLPLGRPSLPSVATLYDLIPLIRRDQYLDAPSVGTEARDWYLRLLEQLPRMSGLLAISESSRNEAIEHLGISPDWVFNIRAGVADTFCPAQLHGDARRTFLTRYGLSDGYVLFLGGGDVRKNEAGLIAAYGLLPPDIRAAHKLAIVAKVDEPALRAKAAKAGIAATDLILIPFVAESDLAAIYSNCALFVFPSFHEGFGLPAAEAMACGAPVIGSDTSSLPEVIGRTDALFNPSAPSSIASLMKQVLTDDGFRRSLAKHGPQQAAGFTWADSAKRAWSALEAINEQQHCRKHDVTTATAARRDRLSLAMTSPLPPQRSGIADYTRHLLPALARYYDITLVTTEPRTVEPELRAEFAVLSPAEFRARTGTFDRVVHQLGNSEFHQFQVDALLPLSAGVTVLHDVFLSDIMRQIAYVEGVPERFRQTLLMAHGIRGLETAVNDGDVAAMRQFPCSLGQIQQSIGVMLHSRHAQMLIEDFYGSSLSEMTRIVPTIRELAGMPGRAKARARLQLEESTFVAATFGGVTDRKMPHEILAGFAASNLARRDDTILAFVGGADDAIASELTRRARAMGFGIGQPTPRGGATVVLTERTTSQTYLDWLAATDIGFQFRNNSRGETSAAAADCLAAGIPVIVNAHGALAELPADAVIMLPDRVETAALAAAIDDLVESPERRRRLGSTGRAYAEVNLSADTVAREYHQAIEAFYSARSPAVAAHAVLRSLQEIRTRVARDGNTVRAIGSAISRSFPEPRPRRVMLDIISWSEPRGSARKRWRGIAVAILTGLSERDRGELLDWRDNAPICAWSDMARILKLEEVGDATARPPMRGDVLLCPMLPARVPTDPRSLALMAWARRGGARVVALAYSRDDMATGGARADFDFTIALDDASIDTTDEDDTGLTRILRAAFNN